MGMSRIVGLYDLCLSMYLRWILVVGDVCKLIAVRIMIFAALGRGRQSLPKFPTMSNRDP